MDLNLFHIMALAKEVKVKESLKDLKKLFKSSKPLFQPRIRMLIVIKSSDKSLSKIELSKRVQSSASSIQTWRSLYLDGGLDKLLMHETKAARPSIFTPSQHKQLEAKFHDPENGFQGYKELHHWVEKTIKSGIKPNSLMVYCRRKFGTKIKVARKSHIKKDTEAVETFKKTLVATWAKL